MSIVFPGDFMKEHKKEQGWEKWKYKGVGGMKILRGDKIILKQIKIVFPNNEIISWFNNKGNAGEKTQIIQWDKSK